jgi:hypothetical protein
MQKAPVAQAHLTILALKSNWVKILLKWEAMRDKWENSQYF